MNKHSWIAVALFTGIFFASFFVGGHAALFVNTVALLIVTCGTLGAVFLCYPLADLRAALRVVRNVYRRPPPTSAEIISTLLEVALYSRGSGAELGRRRRSVSAAGDADVAERVVPGIAFE